MTDKIEAWALVECQKPLQKLTWDLPKPKGTEVILKVTHCGVCHSDLHNWEGYHDLGDGRKRLLADRGATLPLVLGHEVLGTVVELGPDAANLGVKKGDSRLVYPWMGCGNCRWCEKLVDDKCDNPRSMGLFQHGGFASHLVIAHPRFLLDYGNVDPAIACTFACSGLATFSALSKILPIDVNDWVVLIGSGGLGLSAIEMLRKAYKHEKIIAMDISDDKLEAAKRAGAMHTINSAKTDGEEAIRRLAGGPVINIIDFVASSYTMTMAFNVMDKGGKLVLVGLNGGMFKVSAVDLIFRGATIYGNMRGSLEGMKKVAAMGMAGQLGQLPVTTIPWDEANEAIEKLKESSVIGRLVLVHPESVVT